MSDFSSSLLYAARAAPRLDPAIVHALAQGSADEYSLPDIATATEGFSETTKFANNLRVQPTADQMSVWNLLGPEQKRLLTAQGYAPPKEKGKSLFGKVMGGIGQGMHDIGVPQTLHALGAPLRNVQHAVRFLEYRNEDPSLQNASPSELLAPSTIARLWRQTSRGEHTFDPRVVRKLDDKYGTDKLEIAKELAGGTAPEKLAQQQPPEERLAFVQNLLSDPDLKDMIQQLGGAKMSFGRLLAKELHLPGSPTAPGSVYGRVSGGADAVFDWYADPVALLARNAKTYELKKYGLRDASDLNRVLGNPEEGIPAVPGVQRFFDRAGGHLANGDAARLGREFPFMDAISPTLVQDGVDSSEKLQEWFRSEAGAQAFLSGRASGVTAPVTVMPHLSPGGAARLAAKGAFGKTIDFLADTPARLEERLTQGDLLMKQPIGTGLTPMQSLQSSLFTPVGKFARSLTTLLPAGTEFDPASPGAMTQLRRIGALFLPADKVDVVMNAWAAAPDLGAKRLIYKGMLADLFRSAGMDATSEASMYASRFLDSFDKSVVTRMYTPGGADRMLIDGKEMAAGFLEGDLTTNWGLPNFRVMWAQSKRASLTRSIFGAINNNGIDAFMERAWKPSVLLRLGFPIRAAGEELVGAMMRANPAELIKSRLAYSATKGEALGNADRILPWDLSKYVSSRLAGHISPEIMSGITQPAEWAGAVFGDRARRAFRNVEGRLATQVYMGEARRLFDNGLLEGGLADEISAIHGDAAGYLETPDSLMQMTKDGRTAGRIRMVGTGDFTEYKPTDAMYLQMWKDGLDKIGQSKLSRIALENIDNRDAAITAVSEHLDSPGFAKMRERSIRNLRLRDGREVGVDATASEATKDWANLIVDHVHRMVKAPDGTVLPGFVEPLLAEARGPHMPVLNEIPENQLPFGVVGRDMMPMPQNWLSSVMQKGFDEIVGRPMNWLAREPMYLHNSALARANAEPFRELFTHGLSEGEPGFAKASKLADAHIDEIVMERALHDTIPFIHDPKVRSQFSSVTRNFMPFWFAQEQFYKRWAKTLAYAPESFREGQLILNGIRHSGMLHRDDQGNDYFFYPFANLVQNTLISGYKALTGKDLHLPIPAGLTGQIQFLSAGTERLGLPSFGPLAALPIHAFTDRFPELQKAQETLLGRGAGKPYWEQVTPSSVARIVHYLGDKPDSSSQLASAVMQSIQLLEASGHGLPENATPTEYEQWVDRIRGWSRTLQLTRTIFGFAAPAAPELQFDPAHLNVRLRELMRTLTIDEALKQFASEYPNATAYTVFRSHAKGNEPVPATEHTIGVLNANKDFLKAYPMAGGWFLPQAPTGDKFSMAAYREAFALGMLEHKTPDQFYKDIKFAQAASEYFAVRDHRDQLLAKAKGNSMRTRQINQVWADYSTPFLETHPIFRDELKGGQGQIRRMDTIDQLRMAFADPRAPRTDETDAMEHMLNIYDKYKARNLALRNSVGSYKTQQAKRNQDIFVNWAHGQIVDSPGLEGFYNRLIRNDVES